MANRIKGITIEIGGDSTPLQKALKEVDSSLRNTQAQLKDVNKLLKLDPNNTELLRQKQDLLGSAVEDTKKKLQQEKDALEQLKKQPQTEEVIQQQNALKREIIDTENSLKSYQEELSKSNVLLTQVGNISGEVAEKTKKLSAAAGGMAVALLGNAYNAAMSADDLNTLAKQTGFTAQELQKMQYASDLIDVSMESMTGSMKKLTANMSSGASVFDELGVAIYDSNGNMRDATEVWYDSLEALSHIENETERDAKAMALFGKSAADLSGIVDDGGQALKELGDEAEDLGLILDQDALDAANEFNDAMDRMKARSSAALLKMGNALAKTLVPALEKLLNAVTKVVTWFSNLNGSTQKVILVILGLIAAISPVAGMISKVTSVLSILKIAMVAFNPTVLAVVAVLGVLVAAGVALYNNWDTVKAKAQALFASLSNTFNNIKNTVSNIFTNIRNTISSIISSVSSNVSSVFNTIRNTISGAVNGAWSTVSSVFGSIKSTIVNAISGAWSGISRTLQTIKNAFNFSWSLPNVKLPHFHVSGGKWPYGLGGSGYLPSIWIDWYKKAYTNPVLFKSPTVVPTSSGLKGFGDGNGAEIVMGLNKLRELVGTGGNTVTININGAQNPTQVAQEVERVLVRMNNSRKAVFG